MQIGKTRTSLAEENSINSSFKKSFVEARLVSRNRHFMQISAAFSFQLKCASALFSFFSLSVTHTHPAVQLFPVKDNLLTHDPMRGLYSATLKSPLTTVSFVNH